MCPPQKAPYTLTTLALQEQAHRIKEALAKGLRETPCPMETRRNNVVDHLVNHHALWPCEGCGRYLLCYEIRTHKEDCDGCEMMRAAIQYYVAKLYR